MKVLLKEEMKKIIGGYVNPDSWCNVYCGEGTGQTCGKGTNSSSCPYCVDAGNGKGSGRGEDKICSYQQ